MKKIFIFVFCMFIMSIQICSAKDSANSSLNFNGTKYNLLYSVKNKDFGGYLNEYYKRGETYNIWSDMVAIHHFPNAYSPIDRIKDFKDYLSSMNVPSSLTFDDKNNAAMIDFIIIKSDKMPVVLEFNIFKYEKSKKCGSVAVQYVKRYSATTTMQIEQIKDEFEHNRKKLIKKVKKFKIPQVVTKDIDKCISGAEVGKPEIVSETADENVANINTELTEGNIDENRSADTDNDEIQGNEITAAELSAEDGITKDLTNNDINEDNAAESDDNQNVSKNITPNDSNKEDIAETEDIAENNQEEQNETVPLQEKQVPEGTQQVSQNTQKSEVNPEYEVQTKNKSKKQIKEVNYQIVNSKDDYYAKPRTKKELKKLKKELKKQYKQNLKFKNTVYEVTNNKDELIANPRSKSEMKEYKNALKAKQKEKKSKKKQHK